MAAEEKKEIVEKVKQIISEQLGVDENEVTPSASFVDDLGADSLDQVELVMALEEHFGVEIPDEDAEKLRTVQDAIGYIDKHAKVGKYYPLSAAVKLLGGLRLHQLIRKRMS